MERKSFIKALLLIPFITSAMAREEKQSILPKSILELGAKGDGKSDDTSAFNEYLSKHDHLQLPSGYTFKIGHVELKGKTITGPGKIRIKVGSPCAFLLEGGNNHIENIEFVSQGMGKRPEAEILLGKNMDFAKIIGCVFNGNLFNAIGSNMNSEKDEAYINTPWRSKLIVSHCHFKGEYVHHLYLHRLEDLCIESSFFERSKFDSIRLRQYVRKSRIVNNSFKNIGTSQSTDSKDAIDCYWSGLELNISGNHFEDIATHGLDIKGHSPDQKYGTSRIIVSNNQIRRAAFSGILISSGSKTPSGWKAIQYITISQNHLEGCGHASKNPNDAAIFMRHNQEMVLIEGNQIYQNQQKGIMLGNFEADAPNSRNILIKGNIIHQNKDMGIHIYGGINVLVNGNILDQNKKGLVAESYRNFKLENYQASDNIEK